jgi:PAS domain S-box-containing protein
MNHSQKKESGINFKNVAFAAACGLLLTMGWWSGNRQAASLDNEMREELLQKAVALSGLINPHLAKKLTFTEQDKGTPAYEIIREQLINVGKTLPQRGIYTMAMRHGKIFFGPENYPPHDPMASPPGTEYQQPSAKDLGVFKDQHPTTAGPMTDEYGTFVSALVPFFDPQSGEILMVVGVDILASDWQSRLNGARRGPRLMTLVLLLLIIGGAVVNDWRNQHVPEGTLKIRAWVMVPLMLAMLGGGLIYGVYEYQEFNKMSRQGTLQLAKQVHRQWDLNLAWQAQLLKTQLDTIVHDPALMKAWQDKDFGALTVLAKPFFERLKQDYGISHYYFIEPDRTCFLRVHQPERRGDLIDCYTLRTAERSGEDSWGVELGHLSTLTLSYDHPVKIDGKIIGYLELGMESGRFFPELAREIGMESLMVLRKNYTTQEKFEAGRKIFGFSGQWETYPDYVAIHQTVPDFPPRVDQWLYQKDPSTGIKVFEVPQGKQRFACGVIPLFDIEGRDAARLLIMRDVMSETAARQGTLLLNMSLLLALLGGALALLWSVAGSAERKIDAVLSEEQANVESYGRQFSENSAVMLLFDPVDGHIVDANKAAAKFYGYPRERLLSMNIAEIHTLPASEILNAMMSVSSGYGRQLEFQQRLSDGSVRDVEISASLIQIGNRRVIHSIIHDITERKRTEKELLETQLATINILEDLTETNRRLENFTRELNDARTEADLQSWGLRKANDGIKALYQEMEKKNTELARLDKLKNDFVSIVAHELRNPLMVIREAAILILDGLAGPVAEEQRSYLKMVHQTSDQLVHITNDLLDLAKIESGKIVLNYEPLDFLSVVRQCMNGIKIRAQQKGLLTLENFPGEKLEIMGDFDKLVQVLNNLLNNAYKFTEKGGLTVEVKDLGEEIQCAVIDTGMGISKENLPRLFSKFVQFGKSAQTSEKGSGLGLMISKSIVEAHGGRIWAESELDKGTSFIFTLPKKQLMKKKLGEILVEEKTLTPEQLDQALQKQKERKS